MIRKFEQEAIVNQIMEGIDERIDNLIVKAEKTADFKAIKKGADVILKMKAEAESLRLAINEEEKSINVAIKQYNIFVGEDLYGLRQFGYSTESLEWHKPKWQTRDKVADKLAIALLDPRAQDRIKEIIEAIADEVS